MKILFVYQAPSSFVMRDLHILQEAHEVKSIRLGNSEQMPSPEGIRSLIRLWQGVSWADMTFSWFGKLHAFFAVLFSKAQGKKSAVVAGGDDVSALVVNGKPVGLYARRLAKRFPDYVFKNADLILPVSKYNLGETLTNAKPDPKKVTMIYHGFDPNEYYPMPGVAKEDMAIAVGDITRDNCVRKGFDLFVKSADLLPHMPFTLVGPSPDGSVKLLEPSRHKNVRFTGGLYGEDLVRAYSRARVFTHVAQWESFGCIIAEAMLCQCVPVVSRKTAIPEVVGDCGIYVDSFDPKDIAETIEEALRTPSLARRARERIIETFPLAKRKKALLEAVGSLQGVNR